MAFDILNERRLSITAAAHRLNVSPGCVWRWVLYGIRGGTVRLDSVLIGGKRYTSEERIEAFIARLNSPAGTAPEVRTSKQREAAIQAAEKELAAAGI